MERKQNFPPQASRETNSHHQTFSDKHGHTNEYKAKNFDLCLDGPAYSVYKSLNESDLNDYEALKGDLITFYSFTWAHEF